MSTFLIQGGKKLSGSVQINGSKNAALAVLTASLLNRGVTKIYNVSRIAEVNRLIEIMESIGVSIKRRERQLIITPPKKLDIKNLDYRAAIKTRAIILFLGVLVHYRQKFLLPQPGGCRLGMRTVAPHMYALENFGIKIETTRKYFCVQYRTLRATEIVLYESGDTVTENALLAAALIPGKTIIRFASANYMVQDLCFFLIKLGVKISGVGTTTLVVEGKKNINKSVSYQISEDPIESMFFISLAVTTHSHLRILRCPVDFLRLELLKLEKMGMRYKILRHYLSYNKKTQLIDLEIKASLLKALPEKIYGRPYPGINIDNLPYFVPIATQAKGLTLIHDWVYENRAIYYTELNKLGANIILADPHRVYIKGPTKLVAAEIICPPALRPSTNILIAMLAAKGESILRNIYSIERGYENLAGRLQQLGAQIEKID